MANDGRKLVASRGDGQRRQRQQRSLEQPAADPHHGIKRHVEAPPPTGRPPIAAADGSSMPQALGVDDSRHHKHSTPSPARSPGQDNSSFRSSRRRSPPVVPLLPIQASKAA
uniref:Uncharacterized protein n=1 Tax=Oryza barthii TaxID=65489 RepID=A0A0D3HJZ3_9ORYZ